MSINNLPNRDWETGTDNPQGWENLSLRVNPASYLEGESRWSIKV